ncbi:MAG: hypothetical protein ACRDDA_08640, partial [Aeromonas sp.]
MAMPNRFAGAAEDCGGFILQCQLFFGMQPHLYPSAEAKIAFMIGLMAGPALQWAQSFWSTGQHVNLSVEEFITLLKDVFDHSSSSLSVADQLYRLRQGRSSVAEYALRFRTLAAQSGWNPPALIAAYRQGLAIDVRLQMVIFEDTMDLEKFIQRSIQIAQRIAACHRSLHASPTAPPLHPTPAPPSNSPASPPAPESMQIDSSHLTKEERQRRFTMKLCLYCGEAGHFLPRCPVRPPRPMVSTIQPPVSDCKLALTPLIIVSPCASVAVKALIDSGAAGNFISQSLLERLQVASHRVQSPLVIHNILGKPLGQGLVSRHSPLLTLQWGASRAEELSFWVLEGTA